MARTTVPHVTRIAFERERPRVPAAAVAGPVDVVAEAHDEPPVAVPPPWNGLPVTPARLRWRVLRGDRVVRPWHTPVDLGTRFHKQSEFGRIYAPGTRQNHAGAPGLYRFFLAQRGARAARGRRLRVEVEAADLAGNASVRRAGVTIGANGV